MGTGSTKRMLGAEARESWTENLFPFLQLLTVVVKVPNSLGIQGAITQPFELII